MEDEWPSKYCDEEVKEWLKNNFYFNPEDYCVNGGFLHRMVHIAEVKGDGYYESLRKCKDCGIDGRFKLERIPTMPRG